MLEFISLLLKRYQIIQKANVLNGSHYAYQQTLEQLTLTQAFFTKGLHKDNLPSQIAIVAPTQAGKSSIVNVLLNSKSAGVSPLAGYTVHPQGFCYDIDVTACEQYLAEYFFPFMSSVTNQLNKSNYTCYSLSSTESVKISAGMSTNIILKAFTIKKQPKPYSECTEDLTSINSYDSECYRELYLPNRKYFYADCNDMCLQKYLGDVCACQTALFSFSYYKNMRICSTPELNTNKPNGISAVFNCLR